MYSLKAIFHVLPDFFLCAFLANGAALKSVLRAAVLLEQAVQQSAEPLCL